MINLSLDKISKPKQQTTALYIRLLFFALSASLLLCNIIYPKLTNTNKFIADSKFLIIILLITAIFNCLFVVLGFFINSFIFFKITDFFKYKTNFQDYKIAFANALIPIYISKIIVFFINIFYGTYYINLSFYNLAIILNENFKYQNYMPRFISIFDIIFILLFVRNYFKLYNSKSFKIGLISVGISLIFLLLSNEYLFKIIL